VRKSFEKEAKEILEFFTELKTGSKILYRPFIIEITGTPDSGKTSVIATLTRFFKRAGWRVLNPTEGAEITKKVPRTTHLYNIRTGIYALGELLDNTYSLDFDLVIFDRAVYDTYCWQEYWYRKKIISRQVADVIQGFFRQPEVASKIDTCFFVICSAEEALRREAEWALTVKQGETTNLESIEKLINIWQDCYQRFTELKAPVVLLDTTKMSPKQMGNFILSRTIKAMRERIRKIKQA
jgi:thymidylate kinase